jgi:anti-sigma factor RsiW
MPADSMTCRELVQLVTEYLEDALPDQERARFEWHLRGCQKCIAHVAQLRHTVDALGTIREEDVPVEAQTALLGAFRRWKMA